MCNFNSNTSKRNIFNKERKLYFRLVIEMDVYTYKYIGNNDVLAAKLIGHNRMIREINK